MGRGARPHVLLQARETHRTPKDDVMMDFIVTGATVKTAVVALRKAHGSEESITARIRIQSALAELTNPVVHKPRPDNDYNELLISQAGGDGDNADLVTLLVGLAGEPVRFTNVPMHRVHAAIAVLNGDTDTTTPEQSHANAVAHGHATGIMNYADTDSMRTKDFNSRELFGNQIGEERNGKTIKECLECGALVTAHGRHTTWHNKTLP